MELWDAYDADFNKLKGVTLVRGEEPSFPDDVFHLVCDILVRHTDGTYLLMQRDPRKSYGGMWEASACGSALQGETPAAAARRELEEETGIVATKLIEVGRIVDKSKHSVYVEYLCVTDWGKDKIQLQEGETTDYRWVSAGALISMSKDELVTYRIQQFIEEIKNPKMRCALASMGFKNGDLEYNRQAIINTMIKYAGVADIVLFGEAFLQGFYAATFEPEHDRELAVTQDDRIIRDIRNTAKQYSVAVSFGFIEKTGDIFYSSQITIDKNGTVIDVFRRVSPGWKLPHASDISYCEGEGFHLFSFMDKKITVGLCGDFWYDSNIESVKQLHPDIVFWPVYTDYNYNKWNSSAKLEYAEQAGLIGGKVLYVNSVCLDKEEDEIARGGSVLFIDGQIKKEIPSGWEGVLLTDV